MQTLDRVRETLRHAIRPFLKTPAFAAIGVISIAFGTGANTAIFSAVDAMILRPPPIADPYALLTIGSRVDRGVGTAVRMSYRDYLDVRDRVRSFRGLLAFTTRWVGFAITPGVAARIKITAAVSANYFDLLGVRPVLGRAFLPDEDRVPGRDAVAVLSHDVWRQELAADPHVVGRTIRLARVPFTIVGVAPDGFNGLDPFVKHAIYVPMAMLARIMNAGTANPLEDRALRVLTVKGRLASGSTAATVRAELATIGARSPRRTRTPMVSQSSRNPSCRRGSSAVHSKARRSCS